MVDSSDEYSPDDTKVSVPIEEVDIEKILNKHIGPCKSSHNNPCKCIIINDAITRAMNCGIIWSDSTLEKCLGLGIYHKNKTLISKIRALNVKYDTNSLIGAIKARNISLVKQIISEGIQITNKCVYALECLRDQREFEEMLQIFLDNKLVLTKELILWILEHTYCYVPNIEKFGVKYDEDIRKACMTSIKWQYYSELQDIDMLRYVCQNSSFLLNSNLSKFLKKGIKPDIICLQNACKSKISSYTIKRMIKYVKPDIQCIRNACSISGNKSVIVLLSKYVKPDGECIKSLVMNYCESVVGNIICSYVDSVEQKK